MKRRWLLPAALAVIVGCTHPQARLQSEDDGDRERDVSAEVKTIGDLTEVADVNAIPVIGIGLVTQLDGTGGGVPPGPERTTLEEALRKRGCENIKELFGSKTTSLVRIAASIPPGAKKGDPIDLFLSVPENSRTTSLRGGKLEECLLYNFDSTGRISAAVNPNGAEGRPDQMLRGHALVKCEGPVIAGVSTDAENDDPPSLKRGVVWGGGRSLKPDGTFTLTINPDQQYARVAMRIAERINDTFHAPGAGAGSGEIATAKHKSYLMLTVPGAYRLNMARYLRVVRLVPLNETPPSDSEYVRKLSRQLLDPATTITAALRLEALGTQSISVLKVGLNSDVPLVRFAAAESLAYLGSPSCGEELGKQVAEQPFVQAFALTALASLNESVCRVKLQELLSASNPETRFGAFRALRARDERDPLVVGEPCGSFTLHRVAPGSAPQVHLATTKKPEVVLFGDGPKLVAPLTLVVGPEFTLRAEEGKSTCTISRFTTRRGKQTKECSLDVGDAIQALAALGGNFADAAELLRQADSSRGLNCALKVDALPKAPTVYDLARAGVKLAGGRNESLSAVSSDIGVTPTLYEKSATPKAAGPTGAE
ncbi:MAG: flagellar basal body P-ring protein FlgI [Gemmataceae bacterium]